MDVSTTTIASERLVPGAWMPPWTVAEHEARYRFAADYVEGRIVVDCACGNGVGATWFLRRHPERLYGFDKESDAVDHAKTMCRSPNATFMTAGAAALPLPASSCDVFVSFETIEHIAEDAEFVAEIRRVLRPNGILICSTPNRLVTNPGTTIADKPWNPYHVREYAPSELRQVLRRHFEIESEYGQNPVNGLRLAAVSWIGRRIHRRLSVRINQLWKCRWFVFRQTALHHVQPCLPSVEYEYLVFVCRPKASA